jgi:fructose-1,6-bisphosphatase/inositol monophosphatase family enzyme
MDPQQRGNKVTTGKRFWCLDPIDGTSAFMRGGQYAISLSLLKDYERRTQPEIPDSCLLQPVRPTTNTMENGPSPLSADDPPS